MQLFKAGLFALATFAAPSAFGAFYQVCNDTTELLDYAVAYYEGDDESRPSSQGWFELEAGACSEIQTIDVSTLYLNADTREYTLGWYDYNGKSFCTDLAADYDYEGHPACDGDANEWRYFIPFQHENPSSNILNTFRFSPENGYLIQNTIEMCNRTDQTIYAATGNFTTQDNRVETNGWFEISAGNCYTYQNLGYYAAWYVNAVSADGSLNWGSQHQLCVHPTDGFRWLNARNDRAISCAAPQALAAFDWVEGQYASYEFTTANARR